MSALFSPKPLASLSSQLLARKGQAKPAMRSQGFGGFAATSAAVADDLGWNDMGHADAPEPATGPVLALPAPVPPPVVALREVLTEKIEKRAAPALPTPSAAPPDRPVSVAAARIDRDSVEQTKRGKAAFTLRLDADRHLRLRLASALANRSAQTILTEALDRMLDVAPEVDATIVQLPQPERR